MKAEQFEDVEETFGPLPGQPMRPDLAAAIADKSVILPSGPSRSTPAPNPFDAIPAPKKEPVISGVKLKLYGLEDETPATPYLVVKLPPQCRLIYQVACDLKVAGRLAFTAKELTDECVKAGLQTRQLPERIINYYLPRLRKDKLFI